GKVRRPIDDAGAELCERFSFGPRSVVHPEVTAVFEQPGCQHGTHPAGADPADRVAITLCRGHPIPLDGGRLAQTFVYDSSRDFEVSTRHHYSVANVAIRRGRTGGGLESSLGGPRPVLFRIAGCRHQVAIDLEAMVRQRRDVSAPPQDASTYGCLPREVTDAAVT